MPVYHIELEKLAIHKGSIQVEADDIYKAMQRAIDSYETMPMPYEGSKINITRVELNESRDSKDVGVCSDRYFIRSTIMNSSPRAEGFWRE